MVELVHGLRIKLLVIYRLTCVYRADYFDANETAATRRVGQQIFQVLVAMNEA